MITNTFSPHIGGVARSVDETARELRRQGHAVMIICPEFPGASLSEEGVLRIPALQRINGTDFSVALPVSVGLRAALTRFRPDIIHSHHPFLLGDTAVRVAAELMCPLVFTHHTLYEHYTHYFSLDSAAAKRFVIALAIGYGNLCSRVIAPSRSVGDLLRQRGLTTPLVVIPTGVPTQLTGGDRARARMRWGIPVDGFLVGHVGRLAVEKNLLFLAECVAIFLEARPESYCLITGDGSARRACEDIFRARGVSERTRFTGTVVGAELADIYAAMDLFVFTSLSETQGLVLTEAMMNGSYVVALDGSGTRDVIDSGMSGELIAAGDKVEFVGALHRLANESLCQRADRRTIVKAHASRYHIAQTTALLSEVYQELTSRVGPPPAIDLGGWMAFLRRMGAEWSLLSNIAGSAIGSEGSSQSLEPPKYHTSASPLRPSPQPRSPRTSGLILVQIDGLARQEFERALTYGRLPFLQALLAQENYRLVSHYSGLPSTTPAVQGELFYGVRGCVPAFEFFDRRRHEIVRMFSADAAQRIEASLRERGAPLLAQGSSYSNIYGGGGVEARYCAASFHLSNIVRLETPYRIVLRGVWYAALSFRIGVLVVTEIGLALGDLVKGLRSGFPWRHETIFMPTRVLVSIVLRELITLSARLDIGRGLPIIHLNFLGYDEQAHRRGPDSAFAHWSLKGIDRSIRRLARAGEGSKLRRYEVWVYADHGQERTIPYQLAVGRSIGDTVEAIFGEAVYTPPHFVSETIELWRNARPRSPKALMVDPARGDRVVVSAMGPLGHIYLPRVLPEMILKQRCRALVQEGEVPLVLTRIGGVVWAFHHASAGSLRECGREIFGTDHPFERAVIDDLERVVEHPDAGDIVIVGWRSEGESVSFVAEWGAHGGPGSHETHGFALLPAMRLGNEETLRPATLRERVERLRAQAEMEGRGNAPQAPFSTSKSQESGVEGVGMVGGMRRLFGAFVDILGRGRPI